MQYDLFDSIVFSSSSACSINVAKLNCLYGSFITLLLCVCVGVYVCGCECQCNVHCVDGCVSVYSLCVCLCVSSSVSYCK